MTWLFMALLLVASGVVSGSETAVFSLRPAERRRVSSEHPSLGRLLSRPTSLLVNLLLANLLINVAYFTAASAASMAFVEDGRPGAAAAVAGGALVGLVIGGEILPKSLALVDPPRVVVLFIPALLALSLGLSPVASVASGATRLLEGLLLGVSKRRDEPDANDFKSALSSGAVLSGYRAVELALLHDVVDLGVRTSRSLMVPRVDVTFLDLRQDREAWIATMSAHPYTDYPVVDGSPDAIVGMVNSARFLTAADTAREALIEQPLFAPGSIGAEKLVVRMLDERARLAILLDEYGGVSGVVGLADLSHAVLGEVEGLSSSRFLRRPGGAVLIPGDTPLHLLAEEMGLDLTTRASGTLAGALAEMLERVPRRGDEVTAPGWRLRVTSLSGRRVESVLARPLPRQDDGAGSAAPEEGAA